MTIEGLTTHLNTSYEVSVAGSVSGTRTGILKFAADHGAGVYELTTPSGERIGNVILGSDISEIHPAE
jgi:hypothetical protein